MSLLTANKFNANNSVISTILDTKTTGNSQRRYS